MSKYTITSPLPWFARPCINHDGWEVVASDGKSVTGWGRVIQSRSDALLIAEACNNYSEVFGALQSIVNSAFPSQTENPSMFRAWMRAQKVIAKAAQPSRNAPRITGASVPTCHRTLMRQAKTG